MSNNYEKWSEATELLPCAYCGDGRKCCGNFNTLVDPPECRECPERKYYMNKRADRTAAQQMPNIEGVREMNRCPDCKNEFLQQFVCTTCGAEKLYDATVATLRNQLAAAQKDAEHYKSYARSLYLAAQPFCNIKTDDGDTFNGYAPETIIRFEATVNELRRLRICAGAGLPADGVAIDSAMKEMK